MFNQDHLYSRSIAAIGMATQKKLFTLRVLISGLRGVGLEAAKNLILAGLNTVTLHDDSTISLSDLGTNFFINESHINQNRAESVISKLQELNPSVSVKIHKGEITQEIMSQHSLVLLTESDSTTLRRVNSICRNLSPQIGFVSVEVWGVAGHIFVDFGDNFEISDRNGAELKSYLIGNISRSNPGVVTLYGKQKHLLSNGDYIKFKDVEGMTPLNDGRERKVTYIDQHSFSIDEDTTDYPEYIKYGTVEEVRKPFHYDFRPYEFSIKNPKGLKPFMQSKINSPAHLHLAMLAVRKFQEIHGFLPEVHNEDHANLCVSFAREITESGASSQEFSLEKIDENIIKSVSKYARLQIAPITSIFGGIAAQEVIKFTGKFTPIQQWLHMDWLELIHPSASLTDSRYHDLQAIVGEDAINKLKSANLFMVGAGALGCEFLKLFALSGICCGDGELTVTDNDNVKVSNLTRQFLFNFSNVGQSKSECAARSAKIMNPEININVMKNRVCDETDNLFNDNFWGKLTAVFGAVDNANARDYIDDKCVWYKKPLFESGTEGIKATSQEIVPFLTQSYKDSPQPTETKPLSCTLKSYPYEISHCIGWAREKLSDFFTSRPDELNEYLENPEAYLKELVNIEAYFQESGNIEFIELEIKELKHLKEFLEISKINNFDDCITVARHKINKLFNRRIKKLLCAYPPDAKDKEGNDFWSGTRRLPSPLIFDVEKEDHIGFIEAYANLLAFNLNIPQNRDRNYIKEVSAKIQVEELEITKTAIKLDNNEDQQAEEAETKERDKLIKWINDFALENIKPMTPIEFEKDDDSNFHIDFIHAASSLRANNYRISTIERHQTKTIAGKIIPALVTTTAVIAGIVVAEFIKYILGLDMKKSLEFVSTKMQLTENELKKLKSEIPNAVPAYSIESQIENNPVLSRNTHMSPIPTRQSKAYQSSNQIVDQNTDQRQTQSLNLQYCRKSGLPNIGSTSYMNSVIQILASAMDFTNFKDIIPHDPLFTSLIQIISLMKSRNREYEIREHLEEFKRILSNDYPMYGGRAENDAKMLFTTILCQIYDENLFSIVKHQLFTCKTRFQHKSYIDDSNFIVSIPAYRQKDIAGFLNNMKERKEHSGANQLYCSSCNASTDAIFEMVRIEWPDILAIYMQDHYLDEEIPDIIQLEGNVYQLFGVICYYAHHFIAFTKNNENEWVEYNDAVVRKRDPDWRQLYLAFYRIISKS